MQSYIFKWAFSRNYVAPLDELLARGAKVLDLGCGPGVWVIDMANDFPASEFIGLDMCDIWPKPCSPNSPIQRHFPAFRPTTSRPTSPEMMKSPVDALVQNSNRKITSPSPSSCPSPKLDLEATTDNNQPSTSIATSADTDFELPPNLFFKQANILDGLPYENDQFDFVHQRCFQYAYTRRQWTNVLDDIVRVVKPGGWVQLMEVDPKGKRLGPRSDALLLKSRYSFL
ncbi:S-adenosyl-L-methionine-dependent methyltransferase [Jimgerdemannia flammicorona]|uniref:S-adenosyl-L-methionine-dependent methyltransferase n=1 Tax=Jimgerdemannia flammicorona TaxID=994334 RepID=A0A433D7L3_9FUNG|nr:S-adenosyl-L-methionine-dependent methyltransferase [Jimgerdemannia flammicorona]